MKKIKLTTGCKLFPNQTMLTVATFKTLQTKMFMSTCGVLLSQLDCRNHIFLRFEVGKGLRTI